MKGAAIICVGDELVTGLIANGNGHYLSGILSDSGISVRWIKTVADDVDLIVRALEEAFSEVGTCIVTGGLGPTPDDLTLEAVARYFQSPLVLREEVVQRIETRFRNKGMKMPPCNRKQGMLPRDAVLLFNPLGTAPGILMEKEGRRFFFVPGVPREMQSIVETGIIERMAVSPGSSGRILRTFGLAESRLYERLRDFKKHHPKIRLAYLPGPEGVRLRLRPVDSPSAGDPELLDSAEAWIRRILGLSIYGSGEESMAGVVAELLTRKGLTVSVAESCTGGLVSHLLTNIPGSSNFFDRCVVAYSNEAKKELLDVPPEILDKWGAVSAQTAEAMARGVRESGGTDLGISTTGIAGPGGGTREKPVGLVYVGLSRDRKTLHERWVFTGEREINKQRSAMAVLDLLRRSLL